MKKTKNTPASGKNLQHRIRLAIIPHHANQYRPHAIRRYGLISVLVAIIVVQSGYNLLTSGAVLGERPSVIVPEVFAETNKERADRRLAPLAWNETLSKAAHLKARDMFKQQYWAHTAPDGKTPWFWIDQAGYDYSYAGENLARNFPTSQAVLNAWMASSEHAKNITNAHFSEVGFAVVDGELEDKPTTLVVALYGSPASSGVAGVQTALTPEKGADGNTVSVAAKFGMMIQAMSPVVLGSIAVLLALAGVAWAAHLYRNKLPKQLRRTWYRHHGAIKAGGMLSLVVIMIVLYGSGI
jgi:hypothetical protein